jgi:hypothetical protein
MSEQFTFPCIACQHQVSKRATYCPNCGQPVKGGLFPLNVTAIAAMAIVVIMMAHLIPAGLLAGWLQ